MAQIRTVQSSLISTVGFDEDRDVITVVFTNGRMYEYQAPEDWKPGELFVLYLSFVEAPSAGAFFHQFIKGRLPFRKVEQEVK